MLNIDGPLKKGARARISGDPRIIIVGSGIGGLTMAVNLRRAGVRNFEIYEKGDDIGGTWRDNRYPGIACDIPSHLYTLTFFRNPGWTQLNAPGAEIHAYLRRLAQRFDLYPHVRCGKEITRGELRDHRWHLHMRDGSTTTADVLIAATGFLHVAVMPEIPGAASFGGELMHNSRWKPDVVVDGRRVAVIGTGSSGVQLVPALVDRVARLDVYQRTPQWIFPLPNDQYSLWDRIARRLCPWIPAKIFRRYLEEFNSGLGEAVMGDADKLKFFRDLCEAHLATVKDPQLRSRLTPDYPPLCKRLVFSESFYSAIQKKNCELITEPIAQIEPQGVRTRDGTLREVDVIVTATGFKTHEYCRGLGIHGEAGLSLDRTWSEGAYSFEATSVAGFPNFFMLGGPQTTIGNLSYTTCAELQASYIVRALQLRAQQRARSIVPTEQAQQRFLSDMREAAGSTIWKAGCTSWYVDSHGQLDIWPKSVSDFVAMMDKGPQPGDFRLIS